MCYLIHIGIPQSRAGAMSKGRAPRIAPQENPSIAAAFGRGFALFSITDGGCACRLYSPPGAGDDRPDTLDGKTRKYERLGWSRAKIDRALADAGQVRTRQKAAGLRQDVADLIGELAAAFGEVKLLVHEYRGAFATEQIVPLGELVRSACGTITEDVVYIIRG